MTLSHVIIQSSVSRRRIIALIPFIHHDVSLLCDFFMITNQNDRNRAGPRSLLIRFQTVIYQSLEVRESRVSDAPVRFRKYDLKNASQQQLHKLNGREREAHPNRLRLPGALQRVAARLSQLRAEGERVEGGRRVRRALRSVRQHYARVWPRARQAFDFEKCLCCVGLDDITHHDHCWRLDQLERVRLNQTALL